MKKTIHSGFDADGRRFVACSECARGGNGDKSCGAGWNIRRFHGEMCFSGEPLPEIAERLAASKKGAVKAK